MTDFNIKPTNNKDFKVEIKEPSTVETVKNSTIKDCVISTEKINRIIKYLEYV